MVRLAHRFGVRHIEIDNDTRDMCMAQDTATACWPPQVLRNLHQKQSSKVDFGPEPFKVDVYALGVILYSAMVKFSPYDNSRGWSGTTPANFSDRAWRRVSR